MSIKELKSCPSCGVKTHVHKFTWSAVPQVSCDNPSCFMYGVWFTVDDWNKPRQIEDALRIRAEAAEETLKIIFNSLGGEK